MVYGSSGIAGGLATNNPPNNLTEVIDACLALLANPETTIDELIKIIPAPDFPTAGIIHCLARLQEGSPPCRGRVIIPRRTPVADIGQGGRPAIIIDQTPYQETNTRRLL